MTYDKFNDFCRSLPATAYVVQWGGSHVWRVGGKVFAIGGWEESDHPAFTFKASHLNYEILKDQPGFRPAPYMASRGMKWIQNHRSESDSDEGLEYYLRESYRIVSSSLPKRAQRELGLSDSSR